MNSSFARVTPLRDGEADPIRLPPENIAAEQALLGAIFRNNLAHGRVSDFLEPEHFSNAVHARIFEAIGKLIERGQLANPVTLKNLFDQDGALTEIGGAQYLARLAEAAVTIINAEEYGRRIHDLHLRRQLITLGEDIATAAYRHDLDDDAGAQIARAHTALGNLADTSAARRPLQATPFAWTAPDDIPPRAFLYGRHLIRKFVSADIGASGRGKSSLALVDALAMVTGRTLLGDEPADKLRVWHINLEDPADELQRRVAAIARHYGIEARDIGDRLFINSGRDAELVLADQTREGIVIASPVVRALVKSIRQNQIDTLQIDPFVASHRLGENENAAIEAVVRQWVKIADEGNCAIQFIHHTRKVATGQQLTVDDARGASALIAAMRSVRVINPMTSEEAERAGLEAGAHRSFFRVDVGKSNLAPPATAAWRKLVPVPLDNGPAPGIGGDFVAVVEPWKWPDAFADISMEDAKEVQRRIAEGEWREDPRAANWAGKAVASVVGFDLSDKAARASVANLLKGWLSTDALRVVTRLDKQRHGRKFIEVGQWLP